MYKIVRTFYRDDRARALGDSYDEYTFQLNPMPYEQAIKVCDRTKSSQLWINSIVAIEE